MPQAFLSGSLLPQATHPLSGPSTLPPGTLHLQRTATRCELELHSQIPSTQSLHERLASVRGFLTRYASPQPVERENSSVESILSLAECAGLPRTSELEEEDKGRQEVQEIERESQVEKRNA